jgi:cell filamentation protein
VLRNRLGIVRVREMAQAESEALVAVEGWAIAHFGMDYRFGAADVGHLHRQWLGEIYPWAGRYRSVNMAKGAFMFAAAAQLPRLMTLFERQVLAEETPCVGMENERLARALARVILSIPTLRGGLCRAYNNQSLLRSCGDWCNKPLPATSR